jgi:hypothetical protein
VASSRGPLPHEPHQLFQGVFHGWHKQVGAFSALPGAPVEPDDPQPWWRRLSGRKPRPRPDTLDTHEAVAKGHPLRLTGRCGTGPGL